MQQTGPSDERVARGSNDPDRRDRQGVTSPGPEALAELHQSRELLRLLTDNVPAAISYIDGNERYRLVNRTYMEWFGRPREEIIGRTVREVLGPEAYAVIADHIRAALRGDAVTFEASLPYRTGRARHVRARYVPHRDPSDDRVAGCVALVDDVSEAKRAEANERRHLLELAHAARLTLLGEMAGQLMHELAQPLAAITNYSATSAVLLEQDRIAELRDITRKLGIHSRHALAIVQSLRRFLRKEQAELSRIDMRELVQDALRLLQWEADARGVSVRLEVGSPLVPARGNRTLIEQVILNLVHNALDVVGGETKEKAPVVVSVGMSDGAVEVAVRDRGPGLTPEARAHLFEAFFTTKPDGVGIGLVICRRIIESHGGKLWAEDNRNGPGTTFRFTVPTE